jgi:hypothetical protein
LLTISDSVDGGSDVNFPTRGCAVALKKKYDLQLLPHEPEHQTSILKIIEVARA